MLGKGRGRFVYNMYTGEGDDLCMHAREGVGVGVC